MLLPVFALAQVDGALQSARVDLAGFSLDGPARKDLRYARSRAARDGLAFSLLPRAEVPAHLDELRAVSDAWLATKKGREKGFALGYFDADYLRLFDMAVMRREGRIVAFGGPRALSRNDIHLLERASTVAALAITREQAVTAVESKYRAEFLRDALAGRVGSGLDAIAHADSLGWTLAPRMVVVVAETDEDDAITERTAEEVRGLQQRSQGGFPAAADLSAAEAALARAEANEAAANAGVGQARAALRSDRTNVDKASIRSPVDGVVLLRRVEPGQTVAATLQAPVLFTLAESLSQMQLQVNVDEADVGQVKVGQEASFSVDAYPDRRYPATISRVGFGAQTSNGVVTYLTVLEVDNRDLSLRPGMTATAEITTLQREQVRLVPNAALRWSPPDTAGKPASRSIVGSLVPRLPQTARRGGTTAPRAGATRTLWLLGGDGKPQALEVTVGASDGRMTEISTDELRVGQAVIVDSTEAPP